MRNRAHKGATLAAVAITLMICGLSAGPAAAHGTAPKCSMHGTAGPDVIHGTKGPDVICGAGGDDVLYGAAGNDVIYGGAGSDRLYGGPGKDFEDGGAGTNLCLAQDGDRVGSGCASAPGPRSTVADPPPLPTTPSPTPPPPGCEAVGACGSPIVTPSVDELAPSLAGIWVQTKSVDVSHGDAQVTYYVTLWDESTLKGGQLVLTGPSGIWRTVDMNATGPGIADSGADRIIAVPVDIPRSTPPGRYEVAAITLEDVHGNSATTDHAEILEKHLEDSFGRWSTFDVYAEPDATPPVLKDLTLTPSVDTSTAPATADLKIAVTDDLSGVENVWALVRYPATSDFPGFNYGSTLVSGSVFDGVWERQIYLPAHAQQGTYRLATLEIEDRAGNRLRYDEAELEAMGLPTHFEQTGAGDTTRPEILDFKIEPRSLSTSAGRSKLQARIKVRDDLSGFGVWPEERCSEVWFSFNEPGRPQMYSFGVEGPKLVSGTAEEGEWLIEVELPPDAPIGTYPVTYVSATDRAGNQTLLDGPELEAKPWDLSFENE